MPTTVLPVAATSDEVRGWKQAPKVGRALVRVLTLMAKVEEV
jgi:hypothetical protein